MGKRAGGGRACLGPMAVAALIGVLFIGVLVAFAALGLGELRRVVRGDHVVVDLRDRTERRA